MKISVKVKPGAREEYIKEIGEGNFELSVKEPPVQGKANRAVARAGRIFPRFPIASFHCVWLYLQKQNCRNYIKTADRVYLAPRR